jgi:hypothetical protein
MKRGSTSALALFLVMQSNIVRAAAPADTIRPQWVTHLSYVLGYKRLDNQWSPAQDQVEFGLLDFDIRRGNWPVSVAAQFLLTYASSRPHLQNFVGNQSGTYEFNLGLRKVWDDWQPVQPFLGGGLAIIGGSTSSFIDFGHESASVTEDHDIAVGVWLGTGFYWPFSPHWHTGLALQYSTAEIDLFAHHLDAGGVHVMLLFGYH